MKTFYSRVNGTLHKVNHAGDYFIGSKFTGQNFGTNGKVDETQLPADIPWSETLPKHIES